jgi:cytochrome P450
MSPPDREVAEHFDLAHLPPDFYADPYPTYRALRDHAPVKRMPDGSWFLTRFEDVVPVYRDPKRFSSDKKKEFGPKFGPTPLFDHHTTSLIFNDPPLHTRVRRAIVGAITQRHIAAMEPGLAKLVDALLDNMAERREVDLIAGRLTGPDRHYRQPARHSARRARSLRGWSLAILSASNRC